jgi:hypothetical protein
VAHPFPTTEMGTPSFRSFIAEGWETTRLHFFGSLPSEIRLKSS